WLRTMLALMPCGKPHAADFAHLVELLQWLPGSGHFTDLAGCGGRSARTDARWFGRRFPVARLAVAALGVLHPRVPEGLGSALAVDASFVSKSGHGTWGTGWFWSGMARAVRWGLEVTLLAAVDIEEGGAYPLCARQSPGRVRSRRQACGADTGRETTVDTALALVREAVEAGAKESLGTRWVVADGEPGRRTFVEGVRELDLHAVGRLRRDSVLRYPYTGPHERRPGRRRQFDGCFDRRDPARRTRTTLDDEKVDLYHAVLHGQTWQCWLQVVYVLPRGADPQTKEGVLLYSTDLKLAPARLFRIYRARFRIEFAFRDAKQHLGLNHCQARSQAKLHFHFNIVFAALFRARLQAQLRAQRPLGPFSLRASKHHNFEAEIHKWFAARSAAGRNAANAATAGRPIPPAGPGLRAPPLQTGPPGP
ncbi:MAG: transposase, partial [Caldilineaceae bacterium]|nr:transposase [Caldilineaceae bacterium]